ncbi:hypothetical protein JCM10449v2_004923 [Rhodotorula kratochvilovae]
MGAPQTPTRPRVDRRGDLPKTGTTPRAPLSPAKAKPPRPPPTSLLSPETASASAVFSSVGAAISTAEKGTSFSRRATEVSEGWKLSAGMGIVIVHAPTHLQKLKACCSWLHQFEHARYLHAGVPQGAVHWPSYPYRVQEGVETPHLEQMHDYLSSLPSSAPVKRPDPSLWTEIPLCESKPELQAAFMQGTKDRLIFKLSPPAAGMSSALYRRFGSDRFFRINLDDNVAKRAGLPLDGAPTKAAEHFRSRVQTFFEHPLLKFGRQYRPFCWKDGATVYWCESGEGIETIPLTKFAQQALELNGSMSVAKYAARFELGLTDTVLRTPDLNSDTLAISAAAMQAVCAHFRAKRPEQAKRLLPGSYLPSCIRGTVQQHSGAPVIAMVWRLDYSTVPPSRPSAASSTPPDPFIQLRPFASAPATPSRPLLRFSLDEKDGTRVVVLAPEGLRAAWMEELKPVKEGEETVMTDGCSLMSLAAMEELGVKYAASRRENELNPRLPCAAQGRIGPGKGVWACAPPTPWSNDLWIEVRDSQWKFNDSQTREFTFHLHSVPSGKGAAKIGKQLFEILAHCGVPASAFRAMLRKQIETSQEAFWQAPSTAALLYHVEKTCGILEDRTTKARMANDPLSIRRDRDKEQEDPVVAKAEQESGEFVHDRRIDPSSGAPNVVAEVVVEMLQAGFDPRENPHLADKLHLLAENCVKKQIRFSIDDEYSRNVYVVADHLGDLEEGEFFFQTSSPIRVGNGYGCAMVTGPALLSRSPALQPCDIQRATGVYRDEYKTFCDVIVVSSKGERSFCSVLSGGDYDGDQLVVMTSPDLVDAFDPSRALPEYADPPFADSDWFTVDRRRVADVVQPMIDAGDSAALAGVFMEGLFLGTQFGMLSTYHTTLAYSLGLDHPLTRECGHLFCKALDGRKQGLSFSPEKWQAAKAKFAKPCSHKPRWTFCEGGASAPDGEKFAPRPKGMKLHPMDELVLEGARAIKTAKAHWTAWAGKQTFEVDEDLASEWRGAWAIALAERERVAPDRSAYFDDLCAIRDHVRTIFAEFKNLRQSWGAERDRQKMAASHASAPGSPSKSPSKRKGWSGSSRGQKDDLPALTARFWAVNADGGRRFASRELQGETGKRAVRALMASFAYLDPLEPVPEPPAVGTTPLTSRLQACASRSSRSLGLTTSATLSIEASPSKVALRGSAEIVVTNPAGEDEDMAEESFGDGDIAWSQIPDGFSQTAVVSRTSSLSSSQTIATTTAASSSNPSAPPLSPAAAAPRRSWLRGRPFSELTRTVPIVFCFDMAHRDVLGLKADALTRRLHGGHPGAGGIMAPKIAPHILDVLQVSKRCAGITSSRAKVRPRTLLPQPDDADAGGSPAKRARWA